MEEDQIRLEVTLVRRGERDGASEQGESVTVEVSKAWTSPESRTRCLTVLYENGGIIMQDVTLDQHSIQDITLYDSTMLGGYTEAYGVEEHHQIEAFTTLVQLCQEYEIVTAVGKIKEVPVTGPKRVEVTLRALVGAVEKTYVLLDIMPPRGAFAHYSATVRPWLPSKFLSHKKETISATSYWLVKIAKHHGGSLGCTTMHFKPGEQKRAWETVEKYFYELKMPEKKVLENWHPSNVLDDDDNCIYGTAWAGGAYSGAHWTNRGPQYYNVEPEVAHYRVAGDEIGVTLHAEQQATWKEQGSPDPGESLKSMLEEKHEKGEEVPEAASSSSCESCGSQDCPTGYCMEEVDVALGAGLGIPIDGRFTVH